jgi:CheY-like chemotaxis protein
VERARLLVVDDEPDILDALRDTLEDHHAVTTASTGWGALEIMRVDPIDLLITDQRMPHMTGLQLIMRARIDHPDLLAVVLTAYTHPLDLAQALNQGNVYRILTKPWDRAELLATIDGALVEVRARRGREHAR